MMFLAKFPALPQSHDYDPSGAYVKCWIPELRPIDDVQAIFQPWKLNSEQKEELGLTGKIWVEQPLKRIEFHIGRGGGNGGGRARGRGGARGGRSGPGRGGHWGGGRARGEKARGPVRRERRDKGGVDESNENGSGGGQGLVRYT